MDYIRGKEVIIDASTRGDGRELLLDQCVNFGVLLKSWKL